MSTPAGLIEKIKKLPGLLGPGLVTGASDDDPSGIATYAQAGAGFGLATLWTALLTFPLMAALQEMCARIGLVTAKGLTGTLKSHYPRPVLYLMLLFTIPAILLNIGADIAGMGAVTHLFFPRIHAIHFSVAFTALIVICTIRFPYPKIAAVLKYLCMALAVYLVVPFFIQMDWIGVLKATFLPEIRWDKGFLQILVALLGTTISPYLFFWQATMEAEDLKQRKYPVVLNKTILAAMKQDVRWGMLFSNLVMFFIILTTGSLLYKEGTTEITTVEQAATALKPVAGNFSYLLFALGIIGTGFIALPVLSGCVSYMLAETFGWKQGLDRKFSQAKPFYLVVFFSLLIGILINYLGINPVKALVYTAVLYGITAPLSIALILHIANNKKIMNARVNGRWSNVLGAFTLILMTAAAGCLVYFQFF